MTLQSEYIEEHTANSGTVELLEAESIERTRLETELAQIKPVHNETVKKLETMESELLKLRLVTTKQQIEDELQTDSSSLQGVDMLTVIQIDKLKRENESLKKQMTVEKENETLYKQKERNFFENKLKDKDGDIMEAEKHTAMHKRKYQKLCEDMQDTQRLCDSLNVRNNELEKIQRRFDTEMNSFKAKFEVEKDLREKCERERDALKFEIQSVTGNYLIYLFNRQVKHKKFLSNKKVIFKKNYKKI